MDRQILGGIFGFILLFLLLFGGTILFAKGMEFLTDHLSTKEIIAGILVLAILGIAIEFLRRGGPSLTGQERETIRQLAGFIAFFIFFGLTANKIQGWGLDLYLPGGVLGLICMFVAMRRTENLVGPIKPEESSDRKSLGE